MQLAWIQLLLLLLLLPPALLNRSWSLPSSTQREQLQLLLVPALESKLGLAQALQLQLEQAPALPLEQVLVSV